MTSTTGGGHVAVALPPQLEGERGSDPGELSGGRPFLAGTHLAVPTPMRLSVMVWALSIVGLAGGCGTFVKATGLNPAPHPLTPRRPEAVVVFSSGPPARPHVDVALLEVEQTNDINDRPLMIRRLREQAAEIGCDAVVVGGMRERGSDADVFDFGATTVYGTCIVYTAPASPAG